MSTKEKKVIFQLLRKYKKLPFLWDKSHPRYNNRNSRHDGYRALLEIYKQIDETATPQIMLKRIRNLRTTYERERRKVWESIESGAKEIYQPTLWHFDAFRFLDRLKEKPDQSEDTEQTVVSSSSSDEDSRPPSPAQSRELSETPPPQKKRIKTTSVQRKSLIVIQNNTSDNEENATYTEEEYDILGKAIGLQLRDLNRKQQAIVQKIISDSIYYAKMGLLTEEAHVSLGPSNNHLYENHRHKPMKRSPQSPSPSDPNYVHTSKSPLYIEMSPLSPSH